jgi:nitrate reductase gamma subunit
VQLALGMATIPLSGQHLDGGMMLVLAQWAQHIVTFRGGAADLVAGVPWVFKVHMVLGLTLFLVFPFSRLVHIWSGLAAVTYVGRAYQVVRQRS